MFAMKEGLHGTARLDSTGLNFTGYYPWRAQLVISFADRAVALWASTVILFLTGNVNLYPTVILIGNFLIPIVFVAFLYDHQHISRLTPEVIAKSFCLGGILGVLGAAIFESVLIQPPNPNQGLTIGNAMLVGLIEEGCKILAVIFMARRIPHNSALDGLLLGAAVGMGFAAFESTGYAFTAFLLSKGHMSASVIETIIRGVLAPFGHGSGPLFSARYCSGIVFRTVFA
ncbi:PrsW family intramembrane metalloprotease [Dictyobacter kobayashii]|uniref:PrsW family intramembrane metalloprotease n=1 Tax=Dictyobacter kobayashii TaxID=2014872 RepID=A0A402AKI2_9CHLR|nr:PrsW family glutamic-type intramembrane protease [Dictyobacter kobayashii]GCE19636.1 hypothetical protein KDK_34360 [Dictyobacter kobayashii]